MDVAAGEVAANGAALAALAGISVDLASTVAPMTPPKTIDAATADPSRRMRVLFWFMPHIFRAQPQNELGTRCEFLTGIVWSWHEC